MRPARQRRGIAALSRSAPPGRHGARRCRSPPAHADLAALPRGHPGHRGFSRNCLRFRAFRKGTRKGEHVAKQHKVGIVGAGPMAIFLLKYLIKSTSSLKIVIFEREGVAGTGMPYRPDISPDYMLSNIFSREIPPIVTPLADWLRSRPAHDLDRWNLAPDAISARAFYPRTLLGAYLSAQLEALASAGIAAGHDVEVRTLHDVVDIQPARDRVGIVTNAPRGPSTDDFDHVVLATGHTWDAQPTEGDASLVSPWPAANIAALPAVRIGILGSALSAVDVAVALAHAHGCFSQGPSGLIWKALPGHEGLHITMVSKTGILPEADFYYQYPYEPLTHLTEDAVDSIVKDGKGRVLTRTFDLLIEEIESCDPGYLDDLAMTEPTIAAFGTAYFARRQRMGPFRALRVNLAESRATIARKETIAWRYALLRGHAVFEAALPHMSDAEWDEFRTQLLPVFADCYAAVPHLSLERLAALRAADVIEIIESGDDAEFLTGARGDVVVRIADDDHHFPAMIDARGQTPAMPAELPFPALVAALRDPSEPVAAPFRLQLKTARQNAVFCLSMPQVLVRYPFSQGLPNCDTLGKTVATCLLDALG